MDWTWVHTVGTVAIVFLNNLVLWIWKPWASAYAGEKGKALARKEDLDKILAEVRAVTITQKVIEAKISGELWNRQMLWNQKRDFYLELLRRLGDLTDHCRAVRVVLKLNKAPEVAEWSRIAVSLSETARMLAVARIFANKACYDAMVEYLPVLTKAPDDVLGMEWLEKLDANLSALIAELIFAAKADLGAVE